QGKRRSRGCTTPCPPEWHGLPMNWFAYAPAALSTASFGRSQVKADARVAPPVPIVLELRSELACVIEEHIKQDQHLGPWMFKLEHRRKNDGSFVESVELKNTYSKEAGFFPQPIELFDISPTLKLVWGIKEQPAPTAPKPSRAAPAEDQVAKKELQRNLT